VTPKLANAQPAQMDTSSLPIVALHAKTIAKHAPVLQLAQHCMKTIIEKITITLTLAELRLASLQMH
jgi:hypothetical protein